MNNDELAAWLLRVEKKVDAFMVEIRENNGIRARLGIVMWAVAVIYAGVVGWAVKAALAK